MEVRHERILDESSLEQQPYIAMDKNETAREIFFNLLNGCPSSNDNRSKLQKIYDAAYFLYTCGHGKFPSSIILGRPGLYGPKFEYLMAIRRELETTKASDLGIDKIKLKRAMSQRSNRKLFWHVFQTPIVTSALLVLPEGQMIHMHDHPGMVVITKVIFGKLEIKSANILRSQFAPITEEVEDTHSPSPKIVDTPESLRKKSNSEKRAFKVKRQGGAGIVVKESNPLYASLLTVNINDYVEDFGMISSNNHIKNKKNDLENGLINGSRARANPGENVNTVCLFHGLAESQKQVLENSESLAQESLWINEKWRSTFITTPTRGNLHSFRAVEGPVVLLDVMSPPYGVPAKRNCFYYHQNASSCHIQQALVADFDEAESYSEIISPPANLDLRFITVQNGILERKDF